MPSSSPLPSHTSLHPGIHLLRINLLNLSTSLLLNLNVRRGLQGLIVAPLNPDGFKLAVDLLAAALPLLDLGEALAQLLQLALDVHLLAFGADALELPLVALVARAER